MTYSNESVIDFLSPRIIQSLAIPSNVRYGAAIYGRGAVKILENTPSSVEAWVGGLDGEVAKGAGSRRRVTLFVSSGELKWHCAGNPKDHQIFCKHCVALALKLLENSSGSLV